jgi:hypothetical protein
MRNDTFYKRIQLRDQDRFTSFVNKSNWWKFILIIGLFVFLAPFFPRRRGRNYPTTEEEYIQQVIIATVVVAFISIILIWTLIAKPYLNSKRGYNLRGQFEITKKTKILGRGKLKLHPGTNHKVTVDKQTFNYLNVGDNVLIERRAFGDIIKVKRI